VTDEISGFREQMNEMLWDLDDCVEVEGFDPEVYSRLQTLLRTAALRTADIIVRMKLEKLSPRVAVQPVVEDTEIVDVPPEPAADPWGETNSLPEDVSIPEIINGVARRPRVILENHNVPASIGAWEDAMATWSSPRLGAETPVDPKLNFQQDRRSQASSASLNANSVDTRPLTSARYSQASSVTSSLPDRRGRESAVSPVTETTSLSPPPSPWASPTTHTVRPISSTIPEQPGLEATATPGPTFFDGLIPVESSPSLSSGLEVARPRRPHAPSLAIDHNSSFHLLKGFCPGASAALSGALGLKKVKQPSSTLLGAATRTAAKCTHCMFELSWSLVEADLHRRSSANYKTAGVGFRLRFLSKSHLPSKRVDEQAYACLFCVEAGNTQREGDATVWFTQKGLFEHLATHERPLREVRGLVVLEGAEIPEERRDDYDLRFLEPPRVRGGEGSQYSEGIRGVAAETFKAVNGALKTPSDRAPVLQFAVGARIGGVEFPVRYGGEWSVGWADGTRAAFPVESVRLEVPWEVGAVEALQSASAGSGRRAVARWKYNPPREGKDSRRWLRLEKGEVIVGVSCEFAPFYLLSVGVLVIPTTGANEMPIVLYEDHWCWSGRNAKGKWGLFPSTFMEPGSLVEGASVESSAGSIRSQEKAGGVFSRLTNRRKRESWRSASEGSPISGETAVAVMRGSKPSVY